MKGRARDLAAAGALMERAVASPGFSPAARRVAEREAEAIGGDDFRRARQEGRRAEEKWAKAMRGAPEGRRAIARAGSCQSGEGPPPEPERQPAPAADASKHDPRVDKCECGRWKTRGKPRCKHCHGRHARRRQLQESAAPVDKPAADSDPVAAPPSPPLRVRRSGFLWWVCAEDGTRVAGPYGERKLALAAAESGGA